MPPRPIRLRRDLRAAAMALAAASAVFLTADLAALPADRAVRQYVRRAWTVEQGLPHGTVRGFAQTGDGYLWLATYEGLVRFNGEKFRILDKAFSPAMLSNSIVTLLRTKDDTLWLGTLAGLMRYRNGRFETILMEGGADIVYALAASPDGTVWAGTAHGQLLRISGGRAARVAIPLPKIPSPPWRRSEIPSGSGPPAASLVIATAGSSAGPPRTASPISPSSRWRRRRRCPAGRNATGLDRVAADGTVETIQGLPADQ